MKNLIYILCLSLISLTAYSQEVGEDKVTNQARMKELMSKKVDITVDNDIFINVTPNTYVSETPKGVIMAMYIPESYEASKKRMTEEMTEKFRVTDKGEKTINGIKVLYLYGTSNTDGIILNNKIYCMEVDDETCLMVLGMMDESAEKKQHDSVDKILKTAIKK